MELISVLKKNQLFKGLNEEEVNHIAAICQKKEFKGNSVIFKEKSKDSGMFILIQGQVDIQMTMGDDDELATVHVIHEGEVFGELSLVDRSPRSATAKTAGPSLVFILEADKFDELCNKNHRIGLIVMKNIAQIVTSRLRETNIKYTESLIWERLGNDLD